VTLSFSRGALFIVAPYIACSLLFGGGWKYFVCIGITFTGIYLAFDDIIQLVNADLAYSWQLRLGELQSMGNLLGKLQEASGRADLHRLAMDLFLESPLYGHGIASFEALGPGYREAHSMYFTILAEQGMLGIVFMYGLILILAKYTLTGASLTILLALTAYLVFVHSVGYVFVIIPSKSLTINCIAPILLICIYHYACSNANPVSGCDHG
jgi:O-antigen ligase